MGKSCEVQEFIGDDTCFVAKFAATSVTPPGGHQWQTQLGKTGLQMLVLSRKVRKSIEIDSNIQVKITAFKGKRMQIAIDALREVATRRSELALHKVSSKATLAVPLVAHIVSNTGK